MMIFLGKRKAAFLFVICAFMLTGCVVGGSAKLKPNSHFAYPNSNIKALGPVKGESSTVSLMMPTVLTGSMMEEAYRSALSSSGGDMIIDAIEVSTVRLIPIPYISVYYSTFTVEGTAAKMELGVQKLN